jgi:hypothetical protein
LSNQRPFYPEPIYEQLNKIVKVTGVEVIECQVDPMDKGEWLNDGERNYNEMKHLTEALVRMIRERIARLQVDD